MPARIEDHEVHFWNQVEKTDGCWLWKASTTSRGYGQVVRDGKHYFAHRLAFQFATRMTILPGMCVCHKCDNPPCVNPSHLFLGTHRDNIQDASKKGRLAHGEGSWKAVLTDEVVAEARRAIECEPLTVIAKRLGVSVSALNMAVKGRTWKHVKQAPSFATSQLGAEAACDIRVLYNQGNTSMNKLARQFGTDVANISRIINNQIRHNPDYTRTYFPTPKSYGGGRPRKKAA